MRKPRRCPHPLSGAGLSGTGGEAGRFPRRSNPRPEQQEKPKMNITEAAGTFYMTAFLAVIFWSFILSPVVVVIRDAWKEINRK